jgi:2-dehydropantoate 2-reductase
MTRYVIYGAGAIGSILGGNLYRSGFQTILVGRPAHVEAIRRYGLQLKSQGVTRQIKIDALSDVTSMKPGPEDRLLVTLKTQQTKAGAAELARLLPPDTPVVSFQNAVRNEEILASHFHCVYGGLVDFSGNFLKPGCVEHTRNDLIALGGYPSGFDSMAASMADDLVKAGFRVERNERVMEIKWWKLVLNANNALLAVLDCWLQKAFSDPEIYPLMAEVLEESLKVVQSAGITPSPPRGAPPLGQLIRKIRNGELASDFDLPADKRTYPSTWQDLRLQRGETEVEFLNGEIERLGIERRIPTPLNSTLLRLVMHMSKAREVPGKYSPQELARLFKEATSQTSG